jgi:hypothetical protein
MKTSIKIFIILLAGCAYQKNRWVSPKFDTSQIKMITLHNQSSPEEFDIFAFSRYLIATKIGAISIIAP